MGSGSSRFGGGSRAAPGQPPVEPLVVVCDGVGAGVGVLGGGVGLTVALVEDGAGFGVEPPAAVDEPPAAGVVLGCFFPVRAAFLVALALGDGVVDGLVLAPDVGVVPVLAVVVVTGWWLNKFMKPTTPTALSRVARQVIVESLRRPSSRCARSLSRCLMGANETGDYVKRPPRMDQGCLPACPALARGARRWFSLGRSWQ